MPQESGGVRELTTVKVTKAQSNALGRYVDEHDLRSKREALDELGVARLDAGEDGPDALPVAEQIRANAEMNRKLNDRLESLRRTVFKLEGEEPPPREDLDPFSWDV